MSPTGAPPQPSDRAAEPASAGGGPEASPAALAALRHAKRVVVAVVGATLLLLGLIMLVTPGPGTVMLFFGLSILAAEFAWARRWLRRAKVSARLVARRVKGRGGTERESRA